MGCANLKVLKASAHTSKDNEIVIDFHGECENLLFRAQDSNNLEEWKESINSVLNYQGGQDKLMLKTMNKFLYEHKDTLTER